MRILFGTLVLAAILTGCATTPTGSGDTQTPVATGDTQTSPKPVDTKKSPPKSADREGQQPIKETNPVDELFARVNGLIDEGKLDEASEKLKTTRELAPSDPRAENVASRLAEAFAQRAQGLLGERKLPEAQAELRKAFALDRTNPKVKSAANQLAQALSDRAVKWRDEGKPNEAQDAVLSALEFDPENVTANRLAKRIAQDHALRAANLLDEGKEPDARTNLDAARKLDPKNELANTLHGTLTDDPEQTLGSKFFKYTVKQGDTLSKVSEQYLKDQYKFFLLARYNGITVPRNLKVGQTIKVPGTRHAQPAPPPPPPSRPSADVAPQRDPSPPPDQSARMEQIQSYDRKARECYRRQDVDCCVSWWDKVLQLDPLNEPAPRERDRCIRLRDTIGNIDKAPTR
ncbi:MAG TPA: LysM peptidoglycan-binding domain-containing protein [Burkholderiales bacterium]|nr:LysM peptidoglycan-binding domain-containing protein [Burkholderiales bacterium]